MNNNEINFYLCPICKSKLILKINEKNLNDVLDGVLFDSFGHSFKIKNGIPELLDYKLLSDIEIQSLDEYEKSAHFILTNRNNYWS